MGYGTRTPTSNDIPKSKDGESPYLLTNEFEDEFFLLLSGNAKRCSNCRLAIRTKYLNPDNICPDCRSRRK